MDKWISVLLVVIILSGSISLPASAQTAPAEEGISCSFNSIEMSDSLENETIDLSEYCNQLEKSQEFADFMKELDEEKNKVLIIPDGQTLKLNCYFTIPSNTTIQGGAIEFVKDSQPADVFNEAFILNRHR